MDEATEARRLNGIMLAAAAAGGMCTGMVGAEKASSDPRVQRIEHLLCPYQDRHDQLSADQYREINCQFQREIRELHIKGRKVSGVNI